MWAPNKQKYKPSPKRHGFTIVELLIVIVVIAILAAITIVAYNGIQSRAKASAIQQSISQANKKVLAYAVTNSDQYPADLATVGITDSDTTYQYSVNNSASPRTFCITGTNGSQSFYLSSSNPGVVSGACAGHGAGGVIPITNLITNPGVEGGITGWRVNGTAGTGQLTSGGAADGSSFYRVAWASAGTQIFPGTNGAMVTASPGTSYTASVKVRSNPASSMSLYLAWYNSASTYISQSAGPSQTSSTSAWTTLTVTSTAPVNTAQLQLVIVGAFGAGSTLDADSSMATVGTTNYSFADGSTSGWAWTGTPNASTSTGPPL